MTRPELGYYVAKLGTCMARPQREHFKAALGVLGYLAKTKDYGITFGGPLKTPMGLDEKPEGFIESGGLHTYTDSSYGTMRRPFGGFAVMYNNGPVSYSARVMKSVPCSTGEAELDAAAKAAKATNALRTVLEDQGRTVSGATALLIDSSAAQSIIEKPGATARTAYFDRAVWKIKEYYMTCVIAPTLIITELMVADLYTKALEKSTFFLFRAYLMNLPAGREHGLHGRSVRVFNAVIKRLGL
jgi:hypothetical protein